MGHEISFDDINSVADALAEFGTDSKVAESSCRDALSKRVTDIDSILLDYGSVADLDDFESKLTSLMSKHGISTGDVVDQIGSYRETLIEREQEREDENYEPLQTTSPRQNETAQIRSMFSGLMASYSR